MTNKERYNEIIDEAYKRYFIEMSKLRGPFGVSALILTKEEFIEEIKTNDEFSEKWGLKIEERELSFEERTQLYNKTLGDDWNQKWTPGKNFIESRLKTENIPTKLITLTYNNETIESYE